MRHRARAVILGGLAVAAAWTTGAVSNAATGSENTSLTATFVAVTTEPPEQSITTVPADFRAVMGYAPVIAGGMVVNPDGDCSSPVPLPPEFDTACKGHDFGYDLLRYAAATDTELGTDARHAFDRQLDTRMHQACTARTDLASRTSCFTMANVATGFVGANSWRQDYGAPVPESMFPYVGGGALAFAGVALAFALTPGAGAPRRSVVGQLVTA